MQELIDIMRIQREHGGILEAIGGSLNAFDKLRVGNTDETREVIERLATLHSNFTEHVRFEKQEVLSRLTSYAADILTGGVILELDRITASIHELMEQLRGLADGSLDQPALVLFQAKFREKMQDIRWLVEDHAQKQDVILELADKVIKRETGYNAQT